MIKARKATNRKAKEGKKEGKKRARRGGKRAKPKVDPKRKHARFPKGRGG